MRKASQWLLVFAAVSALSHFCAAQDKDWRPITPAELQSKTPSVEPDADAEAIFWEVRVDDSGDDDLALKHYVRVKIYTERGRERYSKFDIPFLKGLKIKDLAARVARPDGSIVEIGKNDIFEREIVKTNGIKIKAKSFAIPNIEPGVIIEYRYKEVFSNASANGLRLEFQRDIPIQTLSYYYKTSNKGEPRYQTYNFEGVKWVKDKDNYWLARRTNVPSFKEEPRMPPEDTVQAWMRLTVARYSYFSFGYGYDLRDAGVPSMYWSSVSRSYSGYTAWMNKDSDEIKQAAVAATAGATSDMDKLKKLYDFCQQQIGNVNYDPSITTEQYKKLPKINELKEVLKTKQTYSNYLDMLFGSMAHSLGFETRVSLSGDRSKIFFDPNMTNAEFLHVGPVAVKVDNDWKYFNPGVRYLPFGMLVWYEEDTYAMLVAESGYFWRKTPLTQYPGSNTKRVGKFVLSDDGTLEGDVQIELSGQTALSYRLQNYDEQAATVEESLKNDVKRRLATAEVSNISVENITADIYKPVVQKYHVKIPSYAQKTGKRLFLQPGYFETGEQPVFSSSTRKYDIFFRYPWSENDAIEIVLPKAFQLDNADAPGEIADPSKIGDAKVTIGFAKTTNTLKYFRHFHFGGGGATLFPATSYGALKGLFDEFHKSDSHTLVLKQG